MKLEHYSEKILRDRINGIVQKYLGGNAEVFFFGSRVTGTASQRSDIDVGIDAGMPIDAEVFFKIQEEIEDIPTLYTIDVVDFSQVSPKFRDIALKSIERV